MVNARIVIKFSCNESRNNMQSQHFVLFRNSEGTFAYYQEESMLIRQDYDLYI